LFTWVSMDCCWATSASICRRWFTYSRIGYARLSAIAQITTASTAARPVSRVARRAAPSARLCPRREPGIGVGTGVGRRVTEQLLDPEQLVVLCDPLAACGGAGLDLAAVGGDGQVRDRSVVGLAGAVADHAAEPGPVRQAHRVQGLGHRANLVQLDQQRVRRAFGDAAAQPLGVGDEQ